MSSKQRKRNIKSLLKRGDLKMIAERLEMSYSYLSQAFSPSSSFNFTSELARKVENVMGWQDNCLDISNMPAKKPRIQGVNMMALSGRAAKLANFFPEKKVLLHQVVKLASMEKKLNIVVYDPDSSIFMIADQSDDYENPDNVERLILKMAITGAHYGVIFSADSGVNEAQEDTAFHYADCRSRWFHTLEGKVVEAAYGPEGIFEEVGI